MCGLVAIVQLDGSIADGAAAERMAAVLRHRGPDDEGVACLGPVALAHRRLSIIDLETGHQPMSADGVTIAFNGEIYNYVELREQLRARGHAFRTTSDTEVLLRLYLEYGPEGIAQLNGMFAFVLYDPRAGTVLAARDHFGIKPLYWHRSASQLLFASEIKALLAHPSVAAQVDRDGLDDYLTLQYTLGSATLFRGIRKVMPAHLEITTLATGKTRTQRYWQPSFVPDLTGTEAGFVAELRSLLEDSVHQQMRSDVPVGSYLSGGLDSSTVTMLAARETPRALQTFTGAFAEGVEFDETAHARGVANACGAQMSLIYPTADEFVDLLPTLIYHMDEPAAGPGLFPQFVVSRQAATQVKVCLGGQGGDEIFGGYARYLVAYLEQALKAAIDGRSDEQGFGLPLEELAPNLPAIQQYVPLLQRFMASGLFESTDRRYFRLMDRSEGLVGYSEAFRTQYHQAAVFGRFQGIFGSAGTPSYYDRMLNYDLQTGLPSLLHVEDRVSMAASLESRVPLLDRRIVDLMARVPPRIKFKGGELKYLFKQAIRDLLPPSVWARKDKMGFPVPLQQWTQGGRVRDFFGDVLLSQPCRERGLFDPEAVDRLLGQKAGFSRVLWGMLQLELWHRRFIDAPRGR